MWGLYMKLDFSIKAIYVLNCLECVVICSINYLTKELVLPTYVMKGLNVHSYLYDITKLVLIDDFQKLGTIKEYL